MSNTCKSLFAPNRTLNKLAVCICTMSLPLCVLLIQHQRGTAWLRTAAYILKHCIELQRTITLRLKQCRVAGRMIVYWNWYCTLMGSTGEDDSPHIRGRHSPRPTPPYPGGPYHATFKCISTMHTIEYTKENRLILLQVLTANLWILQTPSLLWLNLTI